MALTETTNTNKSEKKNHETPKTAERKEKPLTKVVIRRLPPNMNKDTFLNQVSPVPDYDYIYTVKGDASLGENSFSRVYINFTKPEDIYNFKEKFDNYVFIDNKGHEYPAVVEFAAFQKIPKKRNKNRVDPKCGTLETDPMYLEFVESLNKPQEIDTKAEYSYQISNENSTKQDSSTPLLEYIKNKRAERLRIREERREERKRKELERKKVRDDERRRRYEEKSPIKSVVIKPQSSKSSSKESKVEGDTEKSEKESSQSVAQKSYEKAPHFKNKDKKFDDRRRDVKPKYGLKKEYPERREYKGRRDDYKERDYRPKFEEKRDSETKVSVKKVKKYSEKREERRVEAQKAEQKKIEEIPKSSNFSSDNVEKSKELKEQTKDDVSSNSDLTPSENLDQQSKHNIDEISKDTEKNTEKECVRTKEKDGMQNKENESASQKRIRNKDRPTLAIYRPGMLSKRRQPESDNENKDAKKE